MDAVFKALADPSRRALLDILFEENGQTLGELCSGLAGMKTEPVGRHGMSRQAVMKHLAVLAEANLVTTLRRGREKLHYLNPVPIAEIADRWIAKFERERLATLARLKREVENGG